jgi:heme-degrading monooxygenase HmoA
VPAPFQLAQLNVARLRAPIDSPQLADFVAWLEPINALADAAPGFVWRLQTEDGDATSIRVFDDDMIIVNMSVWESPDDLNAFVYRSEHKTVFARRREWFEHMDEVYLVLWWVPSGHIPSVDEGVARLQLLRREGPGPDAFTLKAPFPAPTPIG